MVGDDGAPADPHGYGGDYDTLSLDPLEFTNGKPISAGSFLAETIDFSVTFL